jgi:hypothetical protein
MGLLIIEQRASAAAEISSTALGNAEKPEPSQNLGKSGEGAGRQAVPIDRFLIVQC